MEGRQAGRRWAGSSSSSCRNTIAPVGSWVSLWGPPRLNLWQLSSLWIIWHVSVVTSALSGAQPSKKTAPQPEEGRKHCSSSPPGRAGICGPQGLEENSFHALQKCCNCRQSVQPTRNSRSKKYPQPLSPETRAKVCQGCTPQRPHQCWAVHWHGHKKPERCWGW